MDITSQILSVILKNDVIIQFKIEYYDTLINLWRSLFVKSHYMYNKFDSDNNTLKVCICFQDLCENIINLHKNKFCINFTRE